MGYEADIICLPKTSAFYPSYPRQASADRGSVRWVMRQILFAWFLSTFRLGSHKFFYRRNKHKNNYKVDYQRLKDLS